MQLEFPHDIRYAALKLAILNTPGGCSNCHVEDAMAYVQFLDQENGDGDYDEMDVPCVPEPKNGSMKPLPSGGNGNG